MRVCADCRFFVPGSYSVNQCRRRAPQVVVTTVREQNCHDYDRVDSEWPQVNADHWCGEFAIKVPQIVKSAGGAAMTEG